VSARAEAINSSTAPCESGCDELNKTNSTFNYNDTTNNDLIKKIAIWSIKPAPENDDVYGVISQTDPEVVQLALSIKEHGLQEPILVSSDNYIISGHRRRIACGLAGLDHVEVRVHPISRKDNKDAFVKLLVEMNSQRIKSTPLTNSTTGAAAAPNQTTTLHSSAGATRRLSFGLKEEDIEAAQKEFPQHDVESLLPRFVEVNEQRDGGVAASKSPLKWLKGFL
jgi:ParB-like nuclease domain